MSFRSIFANSDAFFSADLKDSAIFCSPAMNTDPIVRLARADLTFPTAELTLPSAAEALFDELPASFPNSRAFCFSLSNCLSVWTPPARSASMPILIFVS